VTSDERLRVEGLVWLIGVVVCLLAATAGPMSVSAGNGWPHLHCSAIVYCQSTATSETVKRTVPVSCKQRYIRIRPLLFSFFRCWQFWQRCRGISITLPQLTPMCQNFPVTQYSLQTNSLVCWTLIITGNNQLSVGHHILYTTLHSANIKQQQSQLKNKQRHKTVGTLHH